MPKRTTGKKKTTAKRTKRTTTKAQDPDQIYLSDHEKTKLLLLDAKIKNSELAKRLKEKEYAEQLSNLKSNLLATVRALETSKTTAKEELAALRAELEEKYNIKFNDYTFHEDTGLLIKSVEESK